jgi:hypothetical protein
MEDPKNPNSITLESIKDKNPNLYNAYKTEEQRVAAEVAKLDTSITKEQKTADAFKELQIAENIRDVDPQGYQNARMNYYTLLKGESWRDEERERIAKAEIEPIVNRYSTQIKESLDEISNQTSTIDAAKGVKDKVLSIKDELQYATTTFQKQLDDLKGAIVMEHKKKEQQKESVSSWFGFILNVLIVLVLITIIVMLLRKFVFKGESKSAYTPPPTTV